MYEISTRRTNIYNIHTQERHCCYFSSILLFAIIAPVIPGNGPNFSHIKREKHGKKACSERSEVISSLIRPIVITAQRIQ